MPIGKMIEQKHFSLKKIGFKTEFKSTWHELDIPNLCAASFPQNKLPLIQITNIEVPTVSALC